MSSTPHDPDQEPESGRELEPAHDHSDGHGLQTTDDPNMPVADPGMEEHVPRVADVDEAAAARAARQVIGMYLAVPVFAIAFVVAYYAIPRDLSFDFGPWHSSAQHMAMGLTLGIGILLIGIATQQWARQLMSNHEVTEQRHPSSTPPEGVQEVNRQLNDGIAESGVPRRKMLIFAALGAVGILAAPTIVLLTDLGPVAGPRYRKRVYETTLWSEGIRLVNDITHKPLRPEDLVIGQLVNGIPENLDDLHGTEYQNEKAKAPIVVVRMNPADITIPDSRADWHVGGILAYSKICTHVGCPISLWEQQTHHLLCPCHQSTFDLAHAGRVLFGPAARSLPQLPIRVNEDGYLVAQRDFDVPVGPSYFERDSRNDYQEGDS